MVKVFESIAGRTDCVKVMFADVQATLAASLPVLFLDGRKAQINWQVIADDKRENM